MRHHKVIIACTSPFFAQDITDTIRIHNSVDVSVSQERDGLKMLLKNNTFSLVLEEECFNKSLTPHTIGILCKSYPGTKFAVFSYTEMEMKKIADFLSLGASSFLDFRLGREECINALDRALSGQDYIPEGIAEKLRKIPLTPPGAVILTKRERQIMTLLVDEYKPRKIAQSLGITQGTVRLHQSKLYAKCGVHSLAGLVKFYLSMNELYAFLKPNVIK
jgi:two-component system nitrate/nitrite response regulator NarL